eukprot:g23983.t1
MKKRKRSEKTRFEKDGSRRRQVASLLKEPVAGPQGSCLLGACVNGPTSKPADLNREAPAAKNELEKAEAEATGTEKDVGLARRKVDFALEGVASAQNGVTSLQELDPKSEPVVGAPQPEQAEAKRDRNKAELQEAEAKLHEAKYELENQEEKTGNLALCFRLPFARQLCDVPLRRRLAVRAYQQDREDAFRTNTNAKKHFDKARARSTTIYLVLPSLRLPGLAVQGQDEKSFLCMSAPSALGAL